MNASLPSRDPDPEDRGQRFRLLVEPHTKSLYRAALHFTNNAADAEDLVQETLMRAWRGFDGFRSGRAPTPGRGCSPSSETPTWSSTAAGSAAAWRPSRCPTPTSGRSSLTYRRQRTTPKRPSSPDSPATT